MNIFKTIINFFKSLFNPAPPPKQEDPPSDGGSQPTDPQEGSGSGGGSSSNPSRITTEPGTGSGGHSFDPSHIVRLVVDNALLPDFQPKDLDATTVVSRSTSDSVAIILNEPAERTNPAIVLIDVIGEDNKFRMRGYDYVDDAPQPPETLLAKVNPADLQNSSLSQEDFNQRLESENWTRVLTIAPGFNVYLHRATIVTVNEENQGKNILCGITEILLKQTAEGIELHTDAAKTDSLTVLNNQDYNHPPST